MDNRQPIWGWRHYFLGTNAIAGTIQMIGAAVAFTLVVGGIFAFLLQNY